ncbi:glycosyltransferase family 2 protein [Sphingomonas sp. JC676]|uniref:glycosyltransferase n=1 Tax=Sphingomonas sp. JC676 TaxID=2768065 RepID=UPI00165797DE|nr:glycosyltransferase family 2 protein [Sphingomonas sp. JC676]MBC9031113.1 glycosyltransferase family 2 protein [Sphingomonas sp. JC676]
MDGEIGLLSGGVRNLIAATATPSLQLTVIIPTFNEAENVAPLAAKLDKALSGLNWEAVYVDDDSADGTSDRVRELARVDRRIRVIQRVGRRGLSSAVVEGMLSSAAPVVAVIDGDMQHDETVLVKLYAAIADEGNDLAIGTRYTEGGSTGEWDESRVKISRLATRLSNLLLKNDVKDPMSGFFAVKREVFVEALPNLSMVGFKILLDMVASVPRKLRIAEIPYTFRSRIAGESKLDSKVAQEFGALLLEKMFGHIVPVRLLMFAAVGGLGLLVHLATLGAIVRVLDIDFRIGQSIAVFTAMTFNYILNNSFTYRDMRLRGARFVRGLFTFYAVCLIGAIGNIGVGEFIYNMHYRWWLAGIAGAVVGVVWNYAASAMFTWNRK